MKKLSSRPIYLLIGVLFVSFLLGGYTSQAFATHGMNVPVLIPTAVFFLFSFIPKNVGIAAFSGSVDMSELASELADYANEAKAGIFSRIVKSAMPNWMTPIADVSDRVPLVELLIGDILQPGGKDGFNPSQAAVKFKNRYGQVRPGKADLQFTQSQIQQMKKSWLGILAKSQGTPTPLDVYSFPFEAYVFGKIEERYGKNLRQAIIKGVYNPTGTGKLDTLDGLLTIIDDDETSGAIPSANVFTGAAITNSNAVAQMEGVALKAMDDEDYADADLIMLCSPKAKLYYEQNFRSLYTALPYNTQMEQPKIHGFNIELMAIPEWTGSNRLAVSPKDNFVMLYDDISRVGNMLVEREKRNLNVMMDVEIGVNYAISEIMWINDQA